MTGAEALSAAAIRMTAITASSPTTTCRDPRPLARRHRARLGLVPLRSKRGGRLSAGGWHRSGALPRRATMTPGHRSPRDQNSCNVRVQCFVPDASRRPSCAPQALLFGGVRSRLGPARPEAAARQPGARLLRARRSNGEGRHGPDGRAAQPVPLRRRAPAAPPSRSSTRATGSRRRPSASPRAGTPRA